MEICGIYLKWIKEVISEENGKNKLCRVIFCGNPPPEIVPGIFSYQKNNKGTKGFKIK